MGGVNNICADKTGTLTLNEMKVTDIYAAEEEVKIEEFSSEKLGSRIVDAFCEG